MRVDTFDFELPPERIAQRPVSPRDAARLLRVTETGCADFTVADLPKLLRAGDLLIFNDTRVIPARLFGVRAEGAEVKIEATLLQVETDTPTESVWRAFARPGKRLREGQEIRFAENFSARVARKLPSGEILFAFDRSAEGVRAGLRAHGAMPLPPYIRGGVGDTADRRDYQTLFAEREGAVAAPTAGLHFTPELIERLSAAGIGHAQVTLHVGAGTFQPVKVDDTEDHEMHAESGEIAAETAERINATRAAGGRIVSVGTTSLRLLESAADSDGKVQPFCGSTSIFITPGYRFRAIDLLLTNFHLPRSTLFMLVAAFSGLQRMKSAYAHAIAADYRFYSYGDCCLLDRLPEGRP